MSVTTFSQALTGSADPVLLERIATEIELVEEELRSHVGSQVPLVAQVASHTLDAGGKRLRPALVALAASATGRPFDQHRARRLGAAMEMIHMATLIHDDVIDHAPTRRGRPTAAATFGNTASILSGDVLLSKAMALLAQDGAIDIIRCVSSAVVEMAEGEVLELQSRGQFELTEAQHLEILRMKTAVFLQACCEVGGYIAGATDDTRTGLAEYGHHLGMAFQIVDDLLDYRGDHVKTGKRQALDFREGCATLPLIYLRPRLAGEEEALARDWFGNGVTDEDVARLCRWMEDKGAFRQASQAAETRISHALAALTTLPDSAERALLETVGRFVVLRQA